MRKTLLALSAVLMGIATCSSLAQTYPTRPVRMIVGSAPGGGSDVLARMLAAKWSEALGQQVVVENRAGASGIIAADLVAKAPADGHLVLLTQASLAINPAMHAKMPYDTLRDLAPIGAIAESALVLVVHPSVPVKTVRELITLARASPGRLQVGSPGQGTQPHLAGALFNVMANADMPSVQYKGSVPAAIGLLTGEISVQFSTMATFGEYIKVGRVRPLGVTSAKRIATLPNVPTIAEAALPGYETTQWFGVLTRAGTPRAIVDRLNQETNRFLTLGDVKEKLAVLDYQARGGTPEEFGSLIKVETEKWGKVIRSAGIKAE